MNLLNLSLIEIKTLSMKDEISNKIRLQHIIESVTEIRTAIANETKESFIENHILRIAVVKWIEIIGEASNHISILTKEAIPDVEWNMIIGLRHIVVHEYFGINFDIIWNIAVNDVPTLGHKIEKFINDFAK